MAGLPIFLALPDLVIGPEFLNVFILARVSVVYSESMLASKQDFFLVAFDVRSSPSNWD